MQLKKLWMTFNYLSSTWINSPESGWFEGASNNQVIHYLIRVTTIFLSFIIFRVSRELIEASRRLTPSESDRHIPTFRSETEEREAEEGRRNLPHCMTYSSARVTILEITGDAGDCEPLLLRGSLVINPPHVEEES